MNKNYNKIITGIENKINILSDKIKKCSDENKKNELFTQIIESKYRLLKIQEEMKGNVLKPEYGDGRFASKYYSDALDMLRVHYYEHFGIDPNITKLTNSKNIYMFCDPTLPILVDSFRVEDKSYSFTIMFENPKAYENYQSCADYDISIKFPFELLTNKDKEFYLKYLFDLVKLYSGKDANLVLFENYSQNGSLSYIALEQQVQKFIFFHKDENQKIDFNEKLDCKYIDFYERLCDNMFFTTIYEDVASGKASKNAVEYVHERYVNRPYLYEYFFEYLLSNNMIPCDNMISCDEFLLKQKNTISNYVKKLLK